MEEAEKKEVKSRRDLALDRIRNKYPDKKFDDDESFFGQINDDYDDYDKKLSGYKEHEKALSDMLSSDPRAASFLTNWRKGEDPTVGLIRQFGTEITDAVNDPERQEEIAAANKEYVDRVAKEKELEETYQKNLAESLKNLDEIQSKMGLDDATIDNAMSFLIGIMQDGIVGKFSPESVEMAIKAINHDADVSQAGQEGEIKGKNTKIEEKLRTMDKGDGTAQLDGKNGMVSKEKKHTPNIFELAAMAK